MNKVVKLTVAGLITVGAWALALVNGKAESEDMVEETVDGAEDVIEDGDIA